MGPVEGCPPRALAASVAQEGLVAALVVVGGAQRRVEAADQPGGGQAVPEVTVGVVVGPERLGAEAHRQAVAPAEREVARPQRVEHFPAPADERGDVGVVLGGVQPRADAGRHPGRDDHGHGAGDHQSVVPAMVGGMAADGAGLGHDVVVEEDHDVAGGLAHPGLEGAELAESVHGERSQARSVHRQSLEHADRGVVGAVDHHDELGRAGVGQHGVDDGGEPVGPADRGQHDAGSGGAAASRPRVTFLAWGAVAGRSAELADVVGGEARCFFPPGGRRPPVLARWILSAGATIWYLWRRRPELVVVTNPPLFAGLVAWAAGRALGVRVALDSHPGGFGAQGDRVAVRLQRPHRWLARRVAFSIVAADHWRRRVEEWGGRAVVVHEAPAGWEAEPVVRRGPLRVLYVGRFAEDEPWGEVVAAAQVSPRCEVAMTGDPVRAGVDPSTLPANVRLVGFLDPVGYRAAVRDADVVLTLTTEPGSVMRAACEAVWAGRPLVLSDWPVARALFPYAVHADNDAGALADALAAVDRRLEELAAAAGPARRLQATRWEDQHGALEAAIHSAITDGGRPAG